MPENLLYEGYYEVPKDAAMAIVSISVEDGVTLVSVQFVSQKGVEWLKTVEVADGR